MAYSPPKVRQNGNKECKILVLGKDGVGKSAIVVRYLTKRFIGDYDPTLESVYTQAVKIDDHSLNVHLLDTAGDFEFGNSSREDQIKWADAMIFTYSVTDRRSFEYVQKLKKEMTNMKDFERTPCILLANKCDLSHFREVTYAEGCLAANRMNVQYFEVSAGEGFKGISEAMQWICKEWIKVARRMKVKRLVSRLQIKQTLRNFGFRERTNTL
ncbi:ras-related and estrogen-regulated growth inhibitor-like [Ptychodera flava]|uniref:ras-related and estrogen-regulated growth inhibitor-like n=1 Tax=Ptychodera flava TaxID=63121 RepID=UPI00396A4605